jgi:predicted Zn-dependent peptidase
VGITQAKADEVCKVLVDELQRFAADVTDEEVARAKSSMTGSLVLALEDTGSRMTRLGRLATSGQDLYTVDEAIRRIDAVDLEQVREVVAATYGAARSIAVVGPFKPGAEDRFAPYAA